MSASAIVPTNESHWGPPPVLGQSWDGPGLNFVELFDGTFVDQWLVDASGLNTGTFILEPGVYATTLVGEYTAYAGSNQLAVAPVSDPGSWTIIFEGSDPLWSQRTFLLSDPSNLVLIGPGGTFYSGNVPGHFLVGRATAGGHEYWVGMEDLFRGEPDNNDKKIGLTFLSSPAPPVEPVPEPTASILMGAGLLCLAFLRRRKRS